MTAAQDTQDVVLDLGRAGIEISYDDAHALRRASLTLHRWAEAECGDSNEYASVAIERDEETDIPYHVTYWHDRNKPTRRRIPDREAGALRRVKAICERYGLHFYHQTDPRGAPIRISREPIRENDYTRAVAI
jgi:hypothetical protein